MSQRNVALTYVRVSRLDEEERAQRISPEMQRDKALERLGDRYELGDLQRVEYIGRRDELRKQLDVLRHPAAQPVAVL